MNKYNYLAVFVIFFTLLCSPALAIHKGVGYTGVEIVTPQGKFDATLSGEWEIDVKKTDQSNSFDPTDRIIVDKKGHYKWIRQGQVISKGKLVQVLPKTDSTKPDKKEYWGITRQGEYYYIYYEQGKIQMKNAQTHTYVANLKKAKKIAK